MLRRAYFDQKGNQLAGTAAGKNIVRRNIAVSGDDPAEGGIISVRIGRKKIQIVRNCFLNMGGQTQRVDIRSEIYNIFLFKIDISTELFNVTSEKYRFCIHLSVLLFLL